MILTCKDIVQNNQETLLPTDTVSRAFYLMRKKGMRYLPVVSEDGEYIGVFTSPTLIKLMLPRAMTIHLGGKNSNKGLYDLNFLNMEEEDFYGALVEVKDEQVQNYLSDEKNIPVIPPNTPIIEGVLLLHKYKRHVILVEPETNQFVGVVSINAILKKIFDEDYQL